MYEKTEDAVQTTGGEGGGMVDLGRVWRGEGEAEVERMKAEG
jgi:hypothetical protein